MRLDRVAGYQGEVEALGYHRNNKGSLHHREIDAYTLPGTAPKWKVGVARATLGSLWSEVLGFELLGVFPESGVAMGDAVAEVLQAADEVTGSFAEDGAAVELERWFGES